MCYSELHFRMALKLVVDITLKEGDVIKVLRLNRENLVALRAGR